MRDWQVVRWGDTATLGVDGLMVSSARPSVSGDLISVPTLVDGPRVWVLNWWASPFDTASQLPNKLQNSHIEIFSGVGSTVANWRIPIGIAAPFDLPPTLNSIQFAAQHVRARVILARGAMEIINPNPISWVVTLGIAPLLGGRE